MKQWIPTTDLLTLRRIGKLQEELGELSAVAARCIIQGVDEVDPASGKVNRDRLEMEAADVYAQIDETILRLGLNAPRIEARRAKKRALMQDYEAFFIDEDADDAFSAASARPGSGNAGSSPAAAATPARRGQVRTPAEFLPEIPFIEDELDTNSAEWSGQTAMPASSCTQPVDARQVADHRWGAGRALRESTRRGDERGGAE